MHEVEDIGKWFFESSIADMKSKGAETNEFAVGFLRATEDAYERYKKYFPQEKIKQGIELIEQDRFFKQPEAIKNETGKMDVKTFLRKFELLTWKSNVLKKFILYAFLKANIEVAKKHFTNEKGENRFMTQFLFLLGIYKIYKMGASNYSSLTANSTNQKIAPSAKIESIEPLIALVEPQIKMMERVAKTGEMSGWDETKTLNFQKYLLAMDMEVIEKDIFNDIQNSFEITKLNRNGEQSERHKILLLWNLFKHSHPQLYHTTGSPDGNRTQEDLNREALLKLIAKPGSSFFE